MTLRKRSFRIANRRRSIAVEPKFWAELQLLAAEQGMKLGKLIEAVYAADPPANLASALRVYAVVALKAKSKTSLGA